MTASIKPTDEHSTGDI
ncbi:hypothetical protein, partial [Cronobacter sakazakii]